MTEQMQGVIIITKKQEEKLMQKIIDIGTIEATQADYKLSLESVKPRSWLKSVSAFANTSGGHIFFGVSDDTHEKIGLDDPQGTASKITDLIKTRIKPQPRFSIVEFDSMTKDRPCIDLMVDNGPDYPYYYSVDRVMEAYVRHGDQSVLAEPHELNNLILKGKNRTYDALPSTNLIEDVSFTLLAATYKRETGDSMVIPRDLVSMGLVDVQGRVSNAGLLLCDQGLVRQSKIVCTRWKGINKGSVDGDALDDKEYCDESLISLLNDAESFIRNNSKNPWSISGMRRIENSDYPFKAVREIIVNAMIHRDYQIIGSEIHVDMFDDRMEITSPGGMLSGRKIQELDIRKVPSMRRNEIIADFFGRLHYMDRRGSGLGRVLDSYNGNNSQPIFTSDTDFFHVMLPNRGFGESDNRFSSRESGKSGLSYQNTAEEDWEIAYFTAVIMAPLKKEFRNKRYDQIIDLFNKYRYQYHFNRRNVADAFGVEEPAASAIIKKCMNLGVVERVKRDEYRFLQRDTKKL